MQSASELPGVGWRNITWTTKPARKCSVPSCRRPVNRGRVRVDNMDAESPGFVCLCMSCAFKIELGIDPDPAAAVPEWELDRREQTNPDA